MEKPTISDITRLLSNMDYLGYTADDIRNISSLEFLVNVLLISHGLKKVSDEVIIHDKTSFFESMTINPSHFFLIPAHEIDTDTDSIAVVVSRLKQKFPAQSLINNKQADTIFLQHPILMGTWEWEIPDEVGIATSIRYLFIDFQNDMFVGISKKDGRFRCIDIQIDDILTTDRFVCYLSK